MRDDAAAVIAELDRLASADHLRLAAPPRCRTVTVPYQEQCDLVVQCSERSASLGWILMTHYQSCAYANVLSADGADSLFADRHVLVAGAGRGHGRGRVDDDGAAWTVHGRWDFVSGAPFATHIVLQFDTDQGSKIGFVPRDALTVGDWTDWASTGLRSTGSVEVIAVAARVPSRLVGTAGQRSLPYDLPERRLGPGLVVVGAAMAALRTVDLRSGGDGPRHEWTRGQAAIDRLGRATAGVLAARWWMHAVASRANIDDDLTARAERRLAEAYAFEVAIAASLLVTQAAGVVGISPAAPAARHHADILTAGAHTELQPHNFLAVLDLLS